MIRFILTVALLATAPIAIAQTSDPEVVLDKLDDKLLEHGPEISKSLAKAKRTLESRAETTDGDISDDMEVLADVMEEMFAGDGAFRNLAALFADVAKDIDVDMEDGATLLSFDGATVARIAHDDVNEKVTVEGMGKSVTLDRETVVENGKDKTRIVIELD